MGQQVGKDKMPPGVPGTLKNPNQTALPNSNQGSNPEMQQQNAQAENDWILDLIVNFMKSPRWRSPINEFIDCHCIEFDEAVQQNQLHWVDYHREFRELVQALISTVLQELAISEIKFLQVCSKGAMMPIHKKIFDDLVSVEDYEDFKKLMIRRKKNIMQQQALDSFNKTPEVEASTAPSQVSQSTVTSQPKSQDNDNDADQISEAQELKLAQEMSLRFQEEQLKRLKMEEQDLAKALEMSKTQYSEDLKIDKNQPKKEQQAKQKPQPKDVKKSKAQEPKKREQKPQKDQKEDTLQPIQQKKVIAPTEIKKPQLGSLMNRRLGKIQQKLQISLVDEEMKQKAKEILSVQVPQPNLKQAQEKKQSQLKAKFSKQELQERKKRLQLQRDLILKKRQEERKKELIEYEDQQPAEKKDNFYLKMMEAQRKRQERIETGPKSEPNAPEDEEQDKKAQAQARKKQIMKEAQKSVFKDLKKEKLEEERQAIQDKIKEVQQNIASKKLPS